MKLSDSSKSDLLSRVRRIEGQARGVAKMIEEDRDRFMEWYARYKVTPTIMNINVWTKRWPRRSHG